MSTEVHVGPKHLIGVFSALMVLTGLTVWVAFQDLGAFNTIVALAIAVVKATLVIAIFMHVRWSERLVAIFATSGFIWLGMMILVFYCDVVMR